MACGSQATIAACSSPINLDNSVQVVDLETRQLGEPSPSAGPMNRRCAAGRAIFYDGRRSLDQCTVSQFHYEGGTNAVPMDTAQRWHAATFKTVLPLAT